MEFEFIEWIRRRQSSSPGMKIPIGDDAAWLRFEGGELLAAVDMLSDGVHFDLREHGPRRAGRKALAVNLSDVAAMAGTPRFALVALGLPRDGGLRLAQEIHEGMAELASEHGVVIAGGDTNSWDAPLAVSVTILATAPKNGPLRRDQAQAGDRILVTGSFGGSIRGRHLDFPPRVREAKLLHERYRLHAGMDVSDGLSVDLSRLAAESNLGAAVNLDRIPITDAARECAAEGTRSPLEHALGDGEDFELILAVPPEDAKRILADQPLDVPVTEIGEFTASGELTQIDSRGNQEPLIVRGYQHRFD
ncbi:MAG: thiamine-phosphate kinase [Planctomycetales bacterium]